MPKKAQVTAFITVGVVLLIIVALIYALRESGTFMPTQEFLGLKLNYVKQKVDSCVNETTHDFMNKISMRGGILEPATYRLYNGYEVAYLCTDIPETDLCLNNMLSLANIKTQLENYLKEKVPSCVNVNGMKKKLFFPEIKDARFDVKADILEDKIILSVSYPITLMKKETSLSLEDHDVAVKIPFGRLYDVTYDIVNSEATTGTFFPLVYMLAKRGKVEIYRDQPYPDKVYVLTDAETGFKFQFAVEGESGHEMV